MDINIELSVLRNPRKHYSRLHPRTTHPPTQERYKKAFRRSVRPAGRTPSAHFSNKRQPTVAKSEKNKAEDIFAFAFCQNSKIVDMDTMRILSRLKELTNRFLSKFWTRVFFNAQKDHVLRFLGVDLNRNNI